ncbi:MAG: endonuclease/exonuclease/phosphatase family protein [Methanocella sp.]
MRFLTWNIRFGGVGADRYEYDPATSGKNVKAIGRSLLSQDADVIVLTEYRDATETGGVIKSMLEAAGYQSYVSNPDLDKNGVLIAFGEGVREHYDIFHSDHFSIDKAALDEIFYYRWLGLKLVSINGSEDVEILGLHIPDVKRSEDLALMEKTLGYKKLFWQALIRYAKDVMDKGENAVITGDFNTGLNSVDKTPGGEGFYLSECMQEMKDLTDKDGRKWVDAWRKFHRKPSHVDYTWYTPGGEGYRLDYAFVSPALGEQVKGARCSDTERVKGQSDHSMLVVDIAL